MFRGCPVSREASGPGSGASSGSPRWSPNGEQEVHRAHRDRPSSCALRTCPEPAPRDGLPPHRPFSSVARPEPAGKGQIGGERILRVRLSGSGRRKPSSPVPPPVFSVDCPRHEWEITPLPRFRPVDVDFPARVTGRGAGGSHQTSSGTFASWSSASSGSVLRPVAGSRRVNHAVTVSPGCRSPGTCSSTVSGGRMSAARISSGEKGRAPG